MEHAVIEFMKYLKLKSLDGTNIVKRCRASSINIIRYADNFVILHENKFVIKSCKEFIQNFLLNLGLKLKDTKTRICHTFYDFEDQPVRFDFLGFNIHQYLIGKFAVRKTKVALNFRTLIRPSKSKIKDHFGEIKFIIIKRKKNWVFGIKLPKNSELIGLKSYIDVPIEKFIKVKGEKSLYDGDTLYLVF